MKKLYFYSALLTVSLAFLIAGCSDVKENIPVNTAAGAHGPGIVTRGATDHHSVLIKNAKYDMRSCVKCHAADYKGGIIGGVANCTRCHTQPKGPEACNTCHGSYRNPSIIAPTSNGAHNPHLYANVQGKVVACTECHTVPATYYAAGHIDNPDDPAEVIFGAFTKTQTNKVGTPNYTATLPTYTPNPSYATATGCANTYCHGYFKNGNQANVVKWTDGANGKKCGTCHGDPVTGNPLPGGTHVQGSFANNCFGCHNIGKFDAGTTTWTVDSTNVHVDGKLRLFGSDRDY